MSVHCCGTHSENASVDNTVSASVEDNNVSMPVWTILCQCQCGRYCVNASVAARVSEIKTTLDFRCLSLFTAVVSWFPRTSSACLLVLDVHAVSVAGWS